jgi:hypothetical protein
MRQLHVQGDVAVRSIPLPTGAVKIENRPLALGEVSGHAHVVEGAADLYELDGKTFVAAGSDGARLRHIKLHTGEKADHEDIVLSPNTCYEVILQNEYNPESAAFERVLD